MANHSLTGAYLPTQAADPPAGGTQISQAVNQLSPFTVPRFTSTADRDQKYSSWVAQGNTLVDGMLCAVGSTLYMRRSGTWQALSVTIADTGWQAVPLASGWTGGVSYRVLQGVLYLSLFANRASWPQSTLIGTLPAAARPSTSYTFLAAVNFGANVFEVRVNTNGQILVNREGGTGVFGTAALPM